MNKLESQGLIAAMSLEEKASLISGRNFWQTESVERLGIPGIFLSDGPHGLRRQADSAEQLGLNPSLKATCFPTAAAIANSWDVQLAETMARHLGKEARAQGVQVLLGPGTNIKRNPLCGRNFEYFSEDPYLAGKLAAAYIRGIQSQGVAACVKHFCANSQETNRMAVDSVIDERSLREIYLTAFEIAVKEGSVRTLMSSYNRVNGVYANENPHILRDILRGEWGYQGVVISDWGACNDRVRGLLAGSDLEMPGTAGESSREVADSVRYGSLDESVLDESVDRLLRLARDSSLEQTEGFDPKVHHSIARQADEASIVLLKNEGGFLPLRPGKSVAILGDFARQPRYQGAGSSVVNPTMLDSCLGCLEDSGIASIGFEAGFRRYGGEDRGLLRRALELASKADIALLYLGLDEASEAEGLDREYLGLPTNQIRLIDELAALDTDIVVVLSCGSVIEMPWLPKIKALVHASLGGQAGAAAVLEVLAGRVNPSGKLAESYPLRYEDVPSARLFPGREAIAEYREGLFVGYRHYDSARIPVLFPFGFGLSYTSFAYSKLRVDHEGVSFELANTGRMAGREVAQLYVSLPESAVFRSAKELKGFAKIALEPGESRQVRIGFDDKSFRYYNVRTNSWEIEGGSYKILIGASSQDIRLEGKLDIEGSGAACPYEAARLPSYYAGQAGGVGKAEFEALLERPLPSARWNRREKLGLNDTIRQCRYARSPLARLLFLGVRALVWLFKRYRGSGQAYVVIMTIYHLPFRGLSKMSGGMISMKMVDGILELANGQFFRGLHHIIRAARPSSRPGRG